MNTRIQELAEQAKNQVPKGILAPDLWIQEYNRIFAELIIKETIQVSRAGIEYGDSIEDAVFKYFGVE